jgi:nucleotide-binding universal stress UspA family protein
MSDLEHAVVLGVGGSADGPAALQFAVREAAGRDCPLVLIRTWESSPLYDGVLMLTRHDLEQAGSIVLQSALDRVEELAPELDCRSRLVEGRPEDELVEAGQRAQLLVLGSPGRSVHRLGRVLSQVAAHASCPVVVVPDDVAGTRGDVVVGIDGDGVSLDAVGYAFEQASRWHAGLVAVMALATGLDAYLPSEGLLEQLQERGRRSLAEELSGWCEQYPDVGVSQLVALGPPVSTLTAAARSAGLLVVGSHGRGTLRALALGSVSSSLLRAAPCSVAVVRNHDRGDQVARGAGRLTGEQLAGASWSSPWPPVRAAMPASGKVGGR